VNRDEKDADKNSFATPVFSGDAQPKRRSILVFSGCVLLVISGLVSTTGTVVMLLSSFITPEITDFPVNAYTRLVLLGGLTGSLSLVASGIFFYLRHWRLALFLMFLGYGLSAFCHSVTSPLAN
jgi:hypothetical protein